MSGFSGMVSSFANSFGDRGFLSTACAGSALLCAALRQTTLIRASGVAILGSGVIAFSLSALVMTAVTKIFSEMGWDRSDFGKIVKWSFTIVYSITLSVAAISGFGLATTLGGSISLAVVALTWFSSVVALAASIALLIHDVMELRAQRQRADVI